MPLASGRSALRSNSAAGGLVTLEMPATDTVPENARAAAHRFIDAFNARDRDALLDVITDDAEFRRLGGEPLCGHDGARALLDAAEDLDIKLVPLRGETADDGDGSVRLNVPVRELIGPDDIERVAEFEIRDGRVAAFTIRPFD
jgi:hypothetical protein